MAGRDGLTMRLGGASALVLAIVAGCAERVDPMTEVEQCRMWSDSMKACAAAAPLALSMPLRSLSDAATREIRGATRIDGVSAACQAALDGTRSAAKAICPTVRWGPLEAVEKR